MASPGIITRQRLLWPLLLLLTSGAGAHIFAQNIAQDFDIRLGKGTTMTEPAHRSIFLSRPAHVFFYARENVVMYLEESLSFSEGSHGWDAIVGVGPMARVYFSDEMPRLLLEAGVGVNLITTREISNRHLGSNVLFSPTVSAGIEVPWTNGSFGLFYMFRHLSNASMFEDNDGINFQFVVFSLNCGLFR